MKAKLKVGAAETAQWRGAAVPPGIIAPKVACRQKVLSVLPLTPVAYKAEAKLKVAAAETAHVGFATVPDGMLRRRDRTLPRKLHGFGRPPTWGISLLADAVAARKKSISYFLRQS